MTPRMTGMTQMIFLQMTECNPILCLINLAERVQTIFFCVQHRDRMRCFPYPPQQPALHATDTDTEEDSDQRKIFPPLLLMLLNVSYFSLMQGRIIVFAQLLNDGVQ